MFFAPVCPPDAWLKRPDGKECARLPREVMFVTKNPDEAEYEDGFWATTIEEAREVLPVGYLIDDDGDCFIGFCDEDMRRFYYDHLPRDMGEDDYYEGEDDEEGRE